MEFKKTLVKVSIYAVCLFVVILAIEFLTIWLLQPNINNFKTTYKLEGKYVFSKGGRRLDATSYLRQGSKSQIIACGISFVGSSAACTNDERILNKSVQVELANYRSIFGVESVVVSISTSNDGYITKYSADYLVALYQYYSKGAAIPFALVASLMCWFLLMSNAIKKSKRQQVAGS